MILLCLLDVMEQTQTKQNVNALIKSSAVIFSFSLLSLYGERALLLREGTNSNLYVERILISYRHDMLFPFGLRKHRADHFHLITVVVIAFTQYACPPKILLI